VQFDIKAISGKLHIPPEVYERIIRNSLVTTQKDLDDLKAAMAEDNYKEMQAIAHRLKGIYSNLRVEELHAAAEQMEAAAKTGKKKNDFIRFFEEFGAHFAELKDFLNKLSP